MNAAAESVDAYLAALPEAERAALSELRRTIHAAAPGAEESISYAMPTFKYRGKRLIYFAAAKKHLAIYGTSAGTVRFTASEPPQADVIANLVSERKAAIDAELAGKRSARA